MLLPKGDKPPSEPNSHRPICLFDMESKLYEHLVHKQLKFEIENRGRISNTIRSYRGPTNCRCYQRGRTFSKGSRQWFPNVFNSASWQLILRKLDRRDTRREFRELVASSLSNRYIAMEAEGMGRCMKVGRSVPQGLVLGSTLWNILYDRLLHIDIPEDFTLISFADEIAMMMQANINSHG